MIIKQTNEDTDKQLVYSKVWHKGLRRWEQSLLTEFLFKKSLYTGYTTWMAVLKENSYNFLQEICHLKLFLSSHNLIDLPSSFSASLSLRSLIFFLLRFLSSRCLTHSDNVINTSSTITVVPHAIHSLHSKSVF